MTLLQIYTEVLNKLRMESADMESNIEAQIKHAINEAYKIVAGKYKQITIDYVPSIQNVVELPKNAIGAVDIDPPLDPKLDRKVGDNILTKRDDGTIFTLKYYATPEKLVNNTDEPNVPDRLVEALIIYPCYVYFVSKKRLDIASAYKAQFDEMMNGSEMVFEQGEEAIINVYGSLFN